MGIYPNTKGFGYAFFEKATKPIMCGMVVVRPVNNEECLQRIDKLVLHFKPRAIVIRKLDERKKNFNRIEKLLKRIDKKYSNNVTIHLYARKNIKVVFKQFKVNTKHEIACSIAKWFPEFKQRLPRYRKPWHAESYSQGMFDAISLVLTYYYLND